MFLLYKMYRIFSTFQFIIHVLKSSGCLVLTHDLISCLNLWSWKYLKAYTAQCTQGYIKSPSLNPGFRIQNYPWFLTAPYSIMNSISCVNLPSWKYLKAEYTLRNGYIKIANLSLVLGFKMSLKVRLLPIHLWPDQLLELLVMKILKSTLHIADWGMGT